METTTNNLPIDSVDTLRAMTMVQLDFQDKALAGIKYWYIQPLSNQKVPEYGDVALFSRQGPYRLRVYPHRYFKFHVYKGDRLLFQSTSQSSLATLRERYDKSVELVCERPAQKLL